MLRTNRVLLERSDSFAFDVVEVIEKKKKVIELPILRFPIMHYNLENFGTCFDIAADIAIETSSDFTIAEFHTAT